jgi:WD40 repeat protein
MPAVFISHSSQDRGAAADMMAVLERLGFERVFLDFDKATGIGVGDNWEKRLYEELSRCHAVLLMLTPAWLASKWCFVELAQARALGKVILPVLCEPLGERFVLPEIQAVDLLQWNADGLERLERRLHAISNELARGFTLDPGRPPYPGIYAFEAEDAAIYFGRDEETRAAIERLDARRTQGGARFVIVIGASGSGKSSLLKASVLPQLARRHAQWVLLPCIRPEKAPLEALAKALAQHVGKPEAWREWHERLAGPEAVAAIERLTQDARIGDARAATVLLPIDQFEEVFTTTGAAERAAFLGLMAAAFDRDLPFMVVATGRSDVLEGLIESSELVHRYEPYALAAMPLERVPRLVEGPAAVAGLNVEKGLSERVVRDLESVEALPLLAHMLSLLYQRGGDDKKLALAEYDALGDPARGLNPIQNSVRLAADEAIARLKPGEQEFAALRDAFVPHLVRVRLDDGKRVRQPARRSELPPDSLRLVGALVEARLLSTRADGGETLVEVTHEALFKAWPTLDTWLSEEQAFLSDLERIRSAHENWTQAPADQKGGELLYGLLLSRARDWLLKYPQRFLGRGMEPLRAFIAASAEVADAERARAQRIRRRVLQSAVAAAVVFAGVAVVAVAQYYEADSARRAAEEAQVQASEAQGRAQSERAIAISQRKQAQITQSQFLTDLARQHYEDHDYGTALALALEALPVQTRVGIRPYVPAAESLLYQAVTALREQRSPDTQRVVSAAFSPDGERVVTTANDGSVQVWDIAKEASLALIGHEGLVSQAVFSPDGSRIATAAEDGTARLWNAATGTGLAVLRGHPGGVSTVAFSPDGSKIVTSGDRTARLWDVRTGTPLVVFDKHTAGVSFAIFSPDGRRILTASRDGTARIWNAADGAEVAVLAHDDSVNSHDDSVNSAAFSPDGAYVATASAGTAWLWNATTGAVIRPLRRLGNVYHVAFSPSGDQLITASNQTARIWADLSGQGRLIEIKHGGPASRATFSPDGRQVLTAGEDKTARIWDAATGSLLATLAPHEEGVWLAAFSADGRRILTLDGPPGKVRLWNAAPHVQGIALQASAPGLAALFLSDRQVLILGRDGGLSLREVPGGAPMPLPGRALDQIRSVAASGDGTRIVVGFEDDTAQVRDILSGKDIAVIGGKDIPVSNPAISADGQRIVGASKDDVARVWNAETGAELLTLSGHKNNIVAAAFSPDRRKIVTTARDRTVRVWDASTGKPLSVFRKHGGEMATAAFSPDGEKVVSASADRTARIWDARTGDELHVLSTPEGSVLTAVFSPDGNSVLTASFDNTARVWDALTGAEVAVLRRHPIPVEIASAAFSPDGTRIVTASPDGVARLWPAFPRTQDLMDHAREIMPRRLTQEQRERFFLGAAHKDEPEKRSPREP